MSVEALVGAGMVALVPIWIAALLLSRLPRPLFWFACALIVVGAGYLIATGEAEDIGRSVGQFLSDHVEKDMAKARAAPNPEKGLGFFVIMTPIVLVLGGLVLWHRLWHRRVALILFVVAFNVSAALILVSPLPEKVARLVFPDEVLKSPGLNPEALKR